MPSYPVLEITGTAEDLEIALSYLQDWGCLGAEERSLIPGPGLRAFFPEDTDVLAVARDLAHRVPAIQCRKGDPQPVQDWLADWKKSFIGFSLGEAYFVLPTWQPAPSIERTILRIDPEQAFGTGTHDTTRMAAMLLERIVRKGDRVVDLGAGTGILAMVSAHLGASEVVAIEPDVEAARCARENVDRNGLSRRIDVEVAGYEAYERIQADVIVANIIRPVLEGAILRMGAPVLVLSGLLVEEVDEFTKALPGYQVRETWTSGEWAAVLLRR